MDLNQNVGIGGTGSAAPASRLVLEQAFTKLISHEIIDTVNNNRSMIVRLALLDFIEILLVLGSRAPRGELRAQVNRCLDTSLQRRLNNVLALSFKAQLTKSLFTTIYLHYHGLSDSACASRDELCQRFKQHIDTLDFRKFAFSHYCEGAKLNSVIVRLLNEALQKEKKLFDKLFAKHGSWKTVSPLLAFTACDYFIEELTENAACPEDRDEWWERGYYESNLPIWQEETQQAADPA